LKKLSVFGPCLLLTLTASALFAQTPVATAPYTLSVFVAAPSGLSAPDSIAVLGDYVFVGYGDNHKADGSDGLNSQVVQFRMDGTIVYTYQVPGHNDGIKVDPRTKLVWALQNEDGNPNLVIINPATHQQKQYTFGPTPHGGGYDDIVFRGCSVYISASNPANNPNTGPAIVIARLFGNMVEVEPVLAGQATATNLLTDATVQLNLQDPDSMTTDPLGNIVLDSQADQQIIIVSNPGTAKQTALQLPLTIHTDSGTTPVQVDDTNFTTSSEGFILISDKTLNNVYKLTRQAFPPNVAFTAANSAATVGTLDFNTGVITPVVTGLGNPGGLVFVDASGSIGFRPDVHGPSCGDRDDWGSGQ